MGACLPLYAQADDDTEEASARRLHHKEDPLAISGRGSCGAPKYYYCAAPEVVEVERATGVVAYVVTYSNAACSPGKLEPVKVTLPTSARVASTGSGTASDLSGTWDDGKRLDSRGLPAHCRKGTVRGGVLREALIVRFVLCERLFEAL